MLVNNTTRRAIQLQCKMPTFNVKLQWLVRESNKMLTYCFSSLGVARDSGDSYVRRRAVATFKEQKNRSGIVFHIAQASLICYLKVVGKSDGQAKVLRSTLLSSCECSGDAASVDTAILRRCKHEAHFNSASFANENMLFFCAAGLCVIWRSVCLQN